MLKGKRVLSYNYQINKKKRNSLFRGYLWAPTKVTYFVWLNETDFRLKVRNCMPMCVNEAEVLAVRQQIYKQTDKDRNQFTKSSEQSTPVFTV